MATPRTGRKRGRPPKPKMAAARSRGRPPKPLSTHPHRFEIAVLKVAERWLGLGSRTTAKGLIAAAFGERGPFDIDPPNPKHPRFVRQLVSLSREHFLKDVDLIRKLAARFPKTDGDAAWLDAVGQAIVIAKTLGPHPHARQAAKAGALFFASAVGEELWARERLLPLIDSLPTPAETEADQKADLDRFARIIADFLSQPVR
jgi:hypothetical protein